jgi:hypothetical protein
MQQKMVKLKAPKGTTSVGSGVGSFSVVNGIVIVPEHVARELIKPSHGFKPLDATEEEQVRIEPIFGRPILSVRKK